ncbi:MAG: hypothetical protein JNM11_02375 [Chitinimonas sp.]|nr:hypothetical protein [Chitinimonas sp.]
MLPPLKPIAIKERLSVLYIERCQLDVIDGAFVAVDATGIRTHIPVGGVACLMLEPGVRVSHAACALAGRVGTLLVWVGGLKSEVQHSAKPVRFGHEDPALSTPATRRTNHPRQSTPTRI